MPSHSGGACGDTPAMTTPRTPPRLARQPQPRPRPRPARWPPNAGHLWRRRKPEEPSRPAHPYARASPVAVTCPHTGWVPSSAGAVARPRHRPTAGRRRPQARRGAWVCHAAVPPRPSPPTNPSGRANAHPRLVGRGKWPVAGRLPDDDPAHANPPPVTPGLYGRARSGVWYGRGPGRATALRTGGGGCRPTGVRVSATHPGHCAPESGVLHLSMLVPGPTTARPRPRVRAGGGGRRLPGRCHPSRRRHDAHQKSGPATARPRTRARPGGGGRRLLEEGDPHLLRFFQIRRISVCLPTTPGPHAHPGRPDTHRDPSHGPSGQRPRAPTGPTGGISSSRAPETCPGPRPCDGRRA